MRSMKQLSIVLFTALLFCGAPFVYGYDVVVQNPEYPNGNGPVIAVDQGHNNFHNLDGRFKIFGELATKDGFNVKPIAETFTKESLADVDILVAATALDAKNAKIVDAEKNGWVLSFNALAAPNFANGLHAQSAYTDDEIAAIKAWVKEGGSLMLVTDHMPFPAASQALAKAFGIIMDNTYAFDEQFLLYAASQGKVGGNSGNYLKFYKNSDGKTDSNGTLYSHTITEGIDYATSFVGGSFRFIPGVVYQPLMELGSKTLLIYPYNHVAYEKSPLDQLSLPLAEGMLQGATLSFGAGRVAVFAEAAMFSARDLDTNGIFNPQAPFNQEFTLNTLEWLAQKNEVACITLGNDVSFTIPNMNLSGLKFGVHFKYNGGLNFKMDKTSLTNPDDKAQEISVSVSKDKSFTIPCINISGKLYTVTLTSPTSNFVDWTLSSYEQK